MGHFDQKVVSATCRFMVIMVVGAFYCAFSGNKSDLSRTALRFSLT